jgi:hypothetical protein
MRSELISVGYKETASMLIQSLVTAELRTIRLSIGCFKKSSGDK